MTEVVEKLQDSARSVRGKKARLTPLECQWVLAQLEELDGHRASFERRMGYAREVLNRPPPNYDYLDHPG